MQHTEQPRVGCGAAIVRDGRILLIKRKRAPEAGCWGLPGGKVDWLEPVERAVCREIEEELGIALERATLLCVGSHRRRERRALGRARLSRARVQRRAARRRTGQARGARLVRAR